MLERGQVFGLALAGNRIVIVVVILGGRVRRRDLEAILDELGRGRLDVGHDSETGVAGTSFAVDKGVAAVKSGRKRAHKGAACGVSGLCMSAVTLQLNLSSASASS